MPMARGCAASGVAGPLPIVLLAAGAGRRMRGGDKLLELVDGVALLRRQAQVAQASGAPVVVCLPDLSGLRAAALHDLPDLQLVTVTDAADGMAASLAAGVRALPKNARAALIWLADMPDIETGDLIDLMARFDSHSGGQSPAPIVQACSQDGAPGHPVIFPADLFGALMTLRGDTGARSVLAAHRHRILPCPLDGNRALVDLDTPEAWAAWRAARMGGA
jgi:molybdenum cofactor cytidylyltransferase